MGKLREKKEMRGRLEKGWKKMKREKRRDNGGEVDESVKLGSPSKWFHHKRRYGWVNT